MVTIHSKPTVQKYRSISVTHWMFVVKAANWMKEAAILLYSLRRDHLVRHSQSDAKTETQWHDSLGEGSGVHWSRTGYSVAAMSKPGWWVTFRRLNLKCSEQQDDSPNSTAIVLSWRQAWLVEESSQNWIMHPFRDMSQNTKTDSEWWFRDTRNKEYDNDSSRLVGGERSSKIQKNLIKPSTLSYDTGSCKKSQRAGARLWLVVTKAKEIGKVRKEENSSVCGRPGPLQAGLLWAVFACSPCR